jgi:hypothetical protein
MPDVGTVTLSLPELADGDQRSLDRLVTLVYDELRRIAEGQLKRGYQDQAHVLAIAARDAQDPYQSRAATERFKAGRRA